MTTDDETFPQVPFPIKRMEVPWDVVEELHPELAEELREAYPDKTIVSVQFTDGEAEPVFEEGTDGER